MTKVLVIFSVINLITLGIVSLGAKSPELKPFPEAEKGVTRFVVSLPEREAGVSVEILAGKMMPQGGAQPTVLPGKVAAFHLKKERKTYYRVTGVVPGDGLGKSGEGGAKAGKRFVWVTPLRVPYDSSGPLVVYAPNGWDVRYRVGPEMGSPPSTDAMKSMEAEDDGS